MRTGSQPGPTVGPGASASAQLIAAPTLTVAQLASQEQLSVAYIYRLLRLPWLAPSIVDAILHGRQPASLNATVLMHQKFRLPIAWTDQRRHLGFG